MLFGAMEDGDNIIPVQMEAEEKTRNPSNLYMVVTAGKIKESEVMARKLTSSG